MATNNCSHSRYKAAPYMQLGAAWKAMKEGSICWIGPTITHCEDCGERIGRYRIRKTATAEEIKGG